MHKPKAIDYLKKGAEGKETVRDFISFGRKILMSQISINAKNEENERLREYITMEQEKLDEGQKFLQEDKERFDKMMNDSEKDSRQKGEEVKRRAFEKMGLIKKIEELKASIVVTENQIKKDDDELQVYKERKHFLDVLAIQAGKKRYQNKLDQRFNQGND